MIIIFISQTDVWNAINGDQVTAGLAHITPERPAGSSLSWGPGQCFVRLAILST